MSVAGSQPDPGDTHDTVCQQSLQTLTPLIITSLGELSSNPPVDRLPFRDGFGLDSSVLGVSSSIFSQPTNPSSTSWPLPVFQSATSNKEHFARRIPMGKPVLGFTKLLSDELIGDDMPSSRFRGAPDDCACARKSADVGGRAQMMRPQRRQWCFRFARENEDLLPRKRSVRIDLARTAQKY
jgi:hypothetical protein